MPKPSGRRWVVLGALVVALVLIAGGTVVGVRWWQDRHRTDLERALAYAPPDGVRFSWTDWRAVRTTLHAHLDEGSSPAQVQAFLDKGYDADLTSGSAMVDSTSLLQEEFGFSPATVDWELLSQSTSGTVLVLGLPDTLGTDHLGELFESLGYQRPDSDTGVWMGGEALLGRLGQKENISPEFQYLALDPGRHLLLTSDNAAYLGEAVGDLGSHQDPGGAGLARVAAAVDAPLSAELYTGAFACKSLAMAGADEEDQAAGAELVEQAGGVHPLDGFAMAAEPHDVVLVALAFESSEAARHDADSRARLAAGPAPGQGGDFTDRFSLGPVTADDEVVLMRLHPTEGSSVLSDLSTGPVLFASC